MPSTITGGKGGSGQGYHPVTLGGRECREEGGLPFESTKLKVVLREERQGGAGERGHTSPCPVTILVPFKSTAEGRLRQGRDER